MDLCLTVVVVYNSAVLILIKWHSHTTPALSLCIFKDCLIKATLVNKLLLLEIYLHLLGSVEFSELEKIKTYFIFFRHLFFLIFSTSGVSIV